MKLTFKDKNGEQWIPMWWRGSSDGVTWSPWFPILDLAEPVAHYNFYQARILFDDEWHYSQIGSGAIRFDK